MSCKQTDTSDVTNVKNTDDVTEDYVVMCRGNAWSAPFRNCSRNTAKVTEEEVGVLENLAASTSGGTIFMGKGIRPKQNSLLRLKCGM